MRAPKAQKAERYILIHRRGFSLACLAGVVGAMPMLRSAVGESQPVDAHFPGWRKEWEGRPLKRLKLGDREKAFATGFPGPVALFDDGERLILIRYTDRPTRRIRPMEDCLEELYRVRRAGTTVDAQGLRWREAVASAKLEGWRVRERIVSQAGDSWTNGELWFWAALLGITRGPWWAIVTFEPVPAG